MYKEEELIKYLEETTTQQLLKDLNNGREPSEVDIKLVNDIQKITKLPTGVMNVLVEYVFLSCNGKLPRPYIEKIADHWTRVKLKDAKEAIGFAKKMHEKIKKQDRNKNAQKTEVTPVERERIKAIRSAIDTGLDDKKLGKFVRTMFNGDVAE